MVRNMSPENSNPKPEETRFLSRQERIERLRQDEQQLRRIIEQRDAVSKALEEDGYGYLIGLFVDPNGRVLGIENRYGGTASNDWRVVRCESSEVEEDQPIRAEIQTISSAKKTKHGRYPFWPIGVEAIDTIYPEDGRAINIFWMSKSESEAKHRGFIVGDLAGNEFLPLDEIVDPKIEAEIKANKEADEFDRLVQPLRDEGLGEDVKIRGGLGTSALSGAALSPASQTR